MVIDIKKSRPMTIGRGKVEVNIPRKRAGNSGHDKALEKFFENILNTMMRSLDFSILKVVLIASPGFYNVRDQKIVTYMNNMNRGGNNDQNIYALRLNSLII